MEIKVQCDCGQKFKFDVEPVHGRMPMRVNCPSCGADATPNANASIKEVLEQTQPASVPPPVTAPAQPSGLRVNRQEPTPPAAPPTAPLPRMSVAPPKAKRAGGGQAMKMISGLLVFLVVGFGTFKLVSKWGRRLSVLHSVMTSEQDSDSTSSGEESKWTLPDDDGTMVLVKTTNDVAVAQACADYCAGVLQKRLVASRVTASDGVVEEEGLYLVRPEYNGCIEIDGPILWDDKQTAILTGLSQFLSRKFGTMTICSLMGDDAEGGIFLVFEKGEKKFRGEHHIMIKNGDLEEIGTTEGDAWATSVGFKAKEGDFKKFTMDDANSFTHQLGFKLYDRPDTGSFLVIREPGAAP